MTDAILGSDRSDYSAAYQLDLRLLVPCRKTLNGRSSTSRAIRCIPLRGVTLQSSVIFTYALFRLSLQATRIAFIVEQAVSVPREERHNVW